MGEVNQVYFESDLLSSATQLHSEHKSSMTGVTNYSPKESVDVVGHQKHFGKLKKSTQLFLQILEKWHQETLDISPPDAIAIRSLFADYVKAFKVGKEAAQDGFNFASQGLVYTEMDTSKTSAIERKNYLDDMKSCATHGRDTSMKALESMRSVRQTFNILRDKTKVSPSQYNTHIIQNEIEDFERKYHDPFEECMNWYIQWWNKIAMTDSYQETNVIQYASSGGDLRLQAIQLQWKALKQFHVDYNDEMQKLEDQYSGIFKLVSGFNPSDLGDVPTHPIPPAQSDSRHITAPSPSTLSSTRQVQPQANSDETNPRKTKVLSKNPLGHIGATESVSKDNTPEPFAPEPDPQKVAMLSEVQQSEEATRVRMIEPFKIEPSKSEINGAGNVLPRSSGRRSRKLSDDGKQANQSASTVQMAPPDLPPLDQGLFFSDEMRLEVEGWMDEKAVTSSEKRANEKGEPISSKTDRPPTDRGRNRPGNPKPSHSSTPSNSLNNLAKPPPGPRPAVARQEHQKPNLPNYSTSLSHSVSHASSGQDGPLTTETTGQHFTNEATVGDQRNVTEALNYPLTLYLETLNFENGTVRPKPQKSKGPSNLSSTELTSGHLVGASKSESESTMTRGVRNLPHTTRKHSNDSNKDACNPVPMSPEVSSLGDPLIRLEASRTILEDKFSLEKDKATDNQENVIPIVEMPGAQVGHSGKPHSQSFREDSNSSSENRKASQSDSKLSDFTQYIPISSGPTVSQSDGRKNTVKGDTWREFRNIPDTVETPGDNHCPNFAEGNAHQIAPSIFSPIDTSEHNPSKKSAQESIQPTNDDPQAFVDSRQTSKSDRGASTTNGRNRREKTRREVELVDQLNPAAAPPHLQKDISQNDRGRETSPPISDPGASTGAGSASTEAVLPTIAHPNNLSKAGQVAQSQEQPTISQPHASSRQQTPSSPFSYPPKTASQAGFPATNTATDGVSGPSNQKTEVQMGTEMTEGKEDLKKSSGTEQPTISTPAIKESYCKCIIM